MVWTVTGGSISEPPDQYSKAVVSVKCHIFVCACPGDVLCSLMILLLLLLFYFHHSLLLLLSIQDWLNRYGYLPPPDPRTSKLQTQDGIEKAIRVMQRFGGIQETGDRMDRDTIKLMTTPRCSLPDIVGSEDLLRRRRRRRKRYALSGLKWHKTDLTWSVHSYPSPSLSPGLPKDLVDTILSHAFKAWSNVAPLTFHRLTNEGGDIKVSFTSLLHNDGYPFDGLGGTLAHAFFPGMDEVAGDTHFDDHEIWSYGGIYGTDLFAVAVHEFGHSLGLSHSSSDLSIMKPYYQGPVGDIASFRLALDDMLAIQQLYGQSPVGLMTLPPPPRPTHTDPSLLERCQGGFDAVADIRGEVFFFKGAQFWRTKQDGSLVSLHPAQIQNFWMGLPPGTSKIDAVYERRSDGRIIFFIVDRVDAAFIWAHNGKTYLFSGGHFWRFDENQKDERASMQPEPGYPRNNNLWTGVPSHMDDVISWGEGDAYFFKDNLYWVLKNGGLSQEVVSQKSIGVDWLQCPAPPATLAPNNPQDPKQCSCDLTGSSSYLRSSWVLLISVILIMDEFIRK
uniref:Peptidase metallopeptidase domain-containing protein n=1 Tax=Mola mola TaxID=94237 RepID=A0A3Q3VL26_MOLML